jgi:hypothetical protein
MSWQKDQLAHQRSLEFDGALHPTMLDLSGTMVTKYRFIAFRREARCVKKTTGAIALAGRRAMA